MSDAASAETDDGTTPTGPADPLGPGSMLYELSHQARWGLVATRAIVLEAAHPQIGAALITNSTFVAHPWRRLHNTVISTQRMVDPDEQVRHREAARLNRLHARITGVDAEGRPFNAADPEARTWVVATLFESTVMMRRLSGQSLDGPALDRLYAEFRAFLALMEPDGGKLPPTLREFWHYYDFMVNERLENTEAVHVILDRLFTQVPAPPLLRDRPAVWAAGRALVSPVATAITVASLPETLRIRLGLSELPGTHTLMHTAYVSTRLATQLLPEAWTRLDTVMAMLDPAYAPQTGGDALSGLRSGAAKAGALLRLLTPVPGTAAVGDSTVRSAARFFSEVLDQTGNGYLDWPDVAAMAREIATRLDLDAAEEDRLFTAFADWWKDLQRELDSDSDGRITGHEYAAAAAAMTSPALIKVAEVLFDVTDTDNDETIDTQEYRDLFRTAFNHNPGNGGDADNSDEQLKRSEFVRRFLNFMTGRQHSGAYDRLFAQS
ncbi:oxygenase MpaB family protein [Actinoallomurus purpureus]|uniref:oxygenase MpaB family protein n=1 Tax=Actinoallomurus purpureus TaxID=478114 RepID=UPI0020920D8A|nr:oxygenase MpaB family protein [Actinoallomurus purpureus]MCO6008127.1 oxygenase MpaB family protein [Actinoallomurus purpureus]